MKNFSQKQQKILPIFRKNRNRAPTGAKRSAHSQTIGSEAIRNPRPSGSEAIRREEATAPAERNSGVSNGLRSDKNAGLRFRVIAALYAKPKAGSFAGYQSFGDAPAKMGDIMPGSTLAP